jgi:hypothetical protein
MNILTLLEMHEEPKAVPMYYVKEKDYYCEKYAMTSGYSDKILPYENTKYILKDFPAYYKFKLVKII